MPISNCTPWRGAKRESGYGSVTLPAHRLAWIEQYGRIPDGMVLHHTCGNKACVNTDHLRLMTQRDHMALHGSILKAQRLAADNRARKTHCKHGHEFTPENTEPNTGGARRCRTCESDRKKRWRNERRSAGLSYK